MKNTAILSMSAQKPKKRFVAFVDGDDNDETFNINPLRQQSSEFSAIQSPLLFNKNDESDFSSSNQTTVNSEHLTKMKNDVSNVDSSSDKAES